MPEGPSIVILKEEASVFEGKKILDVNGSYAAHFSLLKNKKVLSFRSWGKHFLICFNGFFVRIHFLLFGSYRINERRNFEPRLGLRFKNGEFNFYTNSVKLIDGAPDEFYDWEADVMSGVWNPAKAEKKLKKNKQVLACDALMDQEIFSGVGNIIKNEVLFRCRIHPESLSGKLSSKKRKQLVKEASDYSWDFYKWKRAFELRKHWLIYKQQICPRCNIRLKIKNTGRGRRLSYFCNNCQLLYH